MFHDMESGGSSAHIFEVPPGPLSLSWSKITPIANPQNKPVPALAGEVAARLRAVLCPNPGVVAKFRRFPLSAKTSSAYSDRPTAQSSTLVLAPCSGVRAYKLPIGPPGNANARKAHASLTFAVRAH
jgi:hypothetical protein